MPTRRFWIAVGLAGVLGAAAAGALGGSPAAPAESSPGAAKDRVGQLLGATVGPLEAGVEPFSGGRLYWVLGALALATLVTEDITCIAAGVLVARGLLSFGAATGACLAGIFAGDLLLVAAGRWLGRPALARAPLKWFLTPTTVESSARWFRAQGPKVILLSRFLYWCRPWRAAPWPQAVKRSRPVSTPTPVARRRRLSSTSASSSSPRDGSRRATWNRGRPPSNEREPAE